MPVAKRRRGPHTGNDEVLPAPRLTRVWRRFRRLPLWVQLVLWLLLWPFVGALWLLSPPERTPGRVVAAIPLLVLGVPLWAAIWTASPPDGSPPGAEAPGDHRPADGDDPDTGAPDGDDTGHDTGDDTGDAPTDDPGDAADDTAGFGSDDLEVHFLDVGQADAAVVLHAETAILVDAGHWERDDVTGHLERLGVDRLDLVVATHPHADHIGQFDRVLDAVEVDEVWWSGAVTTTRTFERALDALERATAAYEEPRAGDTAQIGSLTLEVVNPPRGVDLDDLHDSGLAVRFTYGDTRVLFTGDAEAETEARMIATDEDGVAADVLQLGHHGSQTSTTAEFLDAVDPTVAVASAGDENPYGHPHDEVLTRLHDRGVQVLRTDRHGTVTVSSDGVDITVATER